LGGVLSGDAITFAKERMKSGELYDPLDPELTALRQQARELVWRFNQSPPGAAAERDALCRQLFGSVGQDLWLEPPFHCDYGFNIHLGDSVYFNFNCVILDPAEVHIGDRVLVGPAVQIYTATHPLMAEDRRTGLESARPVHIESEVWIGGGAILLPGVRVGARSVIGAGSVVTHDLPPGVLAVGNPCRVIRQLAR
jgi:maltose O-acetyltransferase